MISGWPMIAAAAEGRGGDHHRSLTSVATWSLASAVKRSNEGLASGPRGCMVATEGQSFFLSPGLLAGSSFAKRRVWQCGMCRRSELTTGGAGRGLPRRAGRFSVVAQLFILSFGRKKRLYLDFIIY